MKNVIHEKTTINIMFEQKISVENYVCENLVFDILLLHHPVIIRKLVQVLLGILGDFELISFENNNVYCFTRSESFHAIT